MADISRDRPGKTNFSCRRFSVTDTPAAVTFCTDKPALAARMDDGFYGMAACEGVTIHLWQRVFYGNAPLVKTRMSEIFEMGCDGIPGAGTWI